MENKLISIIVPVYNVEKYLVKCIESIIGQTYHNIEIILVDDGSTDKSGELCEDYAKKDSRIHVIHKENGGLSDARNAGMAVAAGEYIGFVDSDDWIEEDMYEELYRLCETYRLDLITARFCLNVGGIDERKNTTGNFTEMSGIELLKNNIFDSDKHQVTNSVWDRLYRREILQGIEFPKGRKYEDICFTTKVFLKAERCGYLDREVYHYMIRDDSIMGKSKLTDSGLPEEIFADLLPQLKEKYELLYNMGQYDLAEGALYNYVYRCQEYCAELVGKGRYREQRQILKKEINQQRKHVKKFCKKMYSPMKELSLYMVFYRPLYYTTLTKLRKAMGRR